MQNFGDEASSTYHALLLRLSIPQFMLPAAFAENENYLSVGSIENIVSITGTHFRKSSLLGTRARDAEMQKVAAFVREKAPE